MRRRIQKNGLTVNAIAGSHVVFFGLDLTKAKRAGCRGFGFMRREGDTGEAVWLRGLKTFEATEPHPTQGESFSTREHPVQGFQWADYGVKPGVDYRYTIVALYGAPDALQDKISIDVKISTEAEEGAVHSAFFNRGSVATQEYARRFLNRKPKDAGPGAYEWLSRGLIEALIGFIGRAGKGWELNAAVYEFQWPAVLNALKDAHDRGAKVSVLFDDIESYDKNGKPKGPFRKNRDAIAAAKIKGLCKGRANGNLMHNKFFVLSKKKKAVAVWTGSTNLTENGIFGHSNVGQIVENGPVADTYLKYWHILKTDPKVDKTYRAANSAASPTPPTTWNKGTTVVFSPRGTTTNLDALDWYAKIAQEANDALFMTFAFGMHVSFKNVYRTNDDLLRMALLEKASNSPQTKEQDIKDIQAIRNRRNVVVAIGNRIRTNAFDRWLAEMDRVNPNVHVYWIHTKYMLVDPLGADPIIVCGSANFSKASNADNDENMLVIRGDKRIADIFFGEYMRLYTHYAFRESVAFYMAKKKAGTAEDWRPQFLLPNDKWMKDYFDPKDKSARNARRAYFAGPMSV